MPIPDHVRADIEGRTGVNLSDLQAHRGPAVSRTASSLSADAYTAAGQVHVPDEAGSLTTEPGRSLVAHELTHAAQQRRLGSDLPAERSPAGAALESEAVRAEAPRPAIPRRSFPVVSRSTGSRSGTPVAGPSMPSHRPRSSGADGSTGTQSDPGAAAVAAGVGDRGPDGVVHFRPPGAAAAPAVVQRATRTDLEIPDIADAPIPPEPAAVPDDPDMAQAPATADDGGAGPAAATGGPGGETEAGGDDDDALEEMAAKLFPRIQRRLRNELLIEREWSGAYADRF